MKMQSGERKNCSADMVSTPTPKKQTKKILLRFNFKPWTKKKEREQFNKASPHLANKIIWSQDHKLNISPESIVDYKGSF